MSKDKPESAAYNAAFIIKSLGLTPLIEDKAAVNVGAITDMKENSMGGFTVYVHGGRSYELDEDQTVKLEALLKDRIEQGKADYADNVRFQMITQNKVAEDLQKGVQATHMIIGDGPQRPPWRRSR